MRVTTARAAGASPGAGGRAAGRRQEPVEPARDVGRSRARRVARHLEPDGREREQRRERRRAHDAAGGGAMATTPLTSLVVASR